MMLDTMDIPSPRQLPVSAIAYRTQFQDDKMAACFMIKNPQDAPIFVTGLSANSSWPSPKAQTDVPGPITNHRHTDKQLASPPERYCPMLAVTRRSLPNSILSTDYPLQTDDSLRRKETLPEEGRKPSAQWALRKPIPPSELLKSKSSFVSGSNTAKSRSSVNFLAKHKVDLRTGFMRSLSRLTPGEMALKHHKDSQVNSARGRRGRDGQPDPDKLNMSDIMHMLKSKSAFEERLRSLDTTPSRMPCQDKPQPDEADSNHRPSPALNEHHQSFPRPARTSTRESQRRQDAVNCEPPLVSSRDRNKDHKLRLQALYSQYHQGDKKGGNSSNKSTKQNRATLNRRPSRQPGQEKRILSQMESFGDDAVLTSADFCTNSSESCSDLSSGSSGDRCTPRSTTGFILQPNSISGMPRQSCLMCKGDTTVGRVRSNRRVRYADQILAPSPDEDDYRSGGPRPTGKDRLAAKGTHVDLEPHHQHFKFTEYINISHPMRPPANSPVSIISDEDEDELMNMHDDIESDQWSTSYHMKRAPTAASNVNGLVRGQARVQSHGTNKATINIFLPQMTT